MHTFITHFYNIPFKIMVSYARVKIYAPFLADVTHFRFRLKACGSDEETSCLRGVAMDTLRASQKYFGGRDGNIL